MALTSGTKLGPYEIRSPLGAGGMGEVYRAHDSRLDREVALKVLPGHLWADASLKQRLEREAKAVSKLSHPHICTLYDIGHQDGMDFLVMEYHGGHRFARVKRMQRNQREIFCWRFMLHRRRAFEAGLPCTPVPRASLA